MNFLKVPSTQARRILLWVLCGLVKIFHAIDWDQSKQGGRHNEILAKKPAL